MGLERNETAGVPRSILKALQQLGLGEAPVASMLSRTLFPVRRPPPPRRVDLHPHRRRESARGALIGTAVGDALGRPAEGRRPDQLTARRADFENFQMWNGYAGGPVGTFTDDTQMTLCIARTLVTGAGRLEPERLAHEFAEWLPQGRGKGRACVEAVHNFMRGEPWWEAGVDSAGNGSAMRAAPIGIASGHDVDRLATDAVLSSVVTHANPMAIAATIGHAWLVARLADTDPANLDPEELLNDLVSAIRCVEDPGAPEREWERRPGRTGLPVRLADRVLELRHWLEHDAESTFDHLYNGAFVLESFPAAVWTFLRFVDEPEEGIVAAVLRGRDADTIASMAGAYLGALHGPDAFPPRWNGPDLEDRDAILNIADQLADLAEPDSWVEVPRPRAPWYFEGIDFALSWDGYAHHDEPRSVGDPTRLTYEESGHLPDELDTLRTALFWEQRRIRWNEPSNMLSDAAYVGYLNALLDRIRSVSGGRVAG